MSGRGKGKNNNNMELEALFKLIDEIKTDLQEKATIKKIDELVAEIKQKDKKIEILESKVAVLENTVRLLSTKCDNNEQYSRRTSVRINNVPLPENGNESSDDVFAKVKNIEESEAEVDENHVDRAHRVGKPFVAEDGVKKQQIIVKFTTWYHRTLFYRARKKLETAKVFLDLTQTKFKLLKSSQAKVRDNDKIEFVFADVNCALCAKLRNGPFKYFNTEEQLDLIMQSA